MTDTDRPDFPQIAKRKAALSLDLQSMIDLLAPDPLTTENPHKTALIEQLHALIAAVEK